MKIGFINRRTPDEIGAELSRLFLEEWDLVHHVKPPNPEHRSMLDSEAYNWCKEHHGEPAWFDLRAIDHGASYEVMIRPAATWGLLYGDFFFKDEIAAFTFKMHFA